VIFIELTMKLNKIKRKIIQQRNLVRAGALILLIGLMIGVFWLASPLLEKALGNVLRGPRMAYSLLTADTSSLDSSNERVNVLILGIGGEEHKEVELTDTMIFASIDKKNADTVMLSIPRDIWIGSLKTKVNAVYYYGEQDKKGGGFVLAKDAVYEILDQPIHYAVLVDFEGFVKAINLLGGIEVKVDRGFDDYRYPIPGKENDLCNGDAEFKCRYEHLHFDAGKQEMDGERALKFVRSRNAEGDEGTDFARSKRQQKVIMAVAKKLFSYKTLLNPGKLMDLKNTFGEHVKFDREFSKEQVTAFMSLFLRFIRRGNEIRTFSIDTGSDDNPGFLYQPDTEEYDQWVLLPRGDDWTEIQKYVEEKIYKGY